MGGRRGRRSGGRSPETLGHRYLRLRLPAADPGSQVPVTLYPRYSTIVGDRLDLDAIDVLVYRPVSIPLGGTLKFSLRQSDDSRLRWDGRPATQSRGAKRKGGPRPRGRRSPTGGRPPRAEGQRPGSRDEAPRSGRRGGGEARS